MEENRRGSAERHAQRLEGNARTPDIVLKNRQAPDGGPIQLTGFPVFLMRRTTSTRQVIQVRRFKILNSEPDPEELSCLPVAGVLGTIPSEASV